MPRNGKIIEAGCGLGRFVVHLMEMGYDIEGIEINPETVQAVKRRRPDVQIFVGDVARLPYPDNSISGVISLGVVEHFIDGPQLPLKEFWRVLKPGCYAIISVPSLNYVRQFKRLTGYYAVKERLKRAALIRRLFGKKPLKPSDRRDWKYYPYFLSGEFFEYRLTKKEFEQELVQAGFEIVESEPIAFMDGLYHEFGRLFVSFRNWGFHPNLFGKILIGWLSKIPFFINHMHLCVVRKPEEIC